MENLYQRAIDEHRPLKVVCIGAGFAGILTAIRFPQHISNLELIIYEKNDDIGGTWYENRYPGVACDIPAHAYQFTFDNNPHWSRFYAPGAEIQDYLKSVSHKYDVEKYVRFRRRFEKADWDEQTQEWRVHIRNLDTDELFIDTCNVLLKATGILNEWKWPEIPGLHEFRGPYMHSANWNDKFDWTDKRVALIGAGSSGIQILPQIQPRAKKVFHFMKGKTWISPVSFGEADPNTSKTDCRSSEEQQRMIDNPDQYLEYRHNIESRINQAQLATIRGTEPQKAFWETSDKFMKDKLRAKPWIYESLRPDFPPGCRRLTPGPGYLEALIEDNVAFINKSIAKIDECGIWTSDGEYHEVDAIIYATGFDHSSRPSTTPITGRAGVTLEELWTPHPKAYMSVCNPNLPNLFFYLGPNGAPVAGSVIVMLEHIALYIIKCCKKLQREHIAAMEVKEVAQSAFQAQVVQYFERSIFTIRCKSWYKQNQEDGPVVALWPGSSMHAEVALESPRFEDFDYVHLASTQTNHLSWLGNGLTTAQMHNGKTTGYLDTADIPPTINSSPRKEKNGHLVPSQDTATSVIHGRNVMD